MSADIRNWFSQKNRQKIDDTLIKKETNITNDSPCSPIEISKMKRLKVYTDGSALANGQKGCCCGGIGVFFADNDSRNIHKEIFRKGITNNQCELLAIYEAIIKIKETEDLAKVHIEFCSDSEYSINVITKWGPQWKKNGWKKKGGDIKNLNLIKHIMNEIIELRYNFKHVKAHKVCKYPKNTEKYNEWYGNYMADQFANQSANNLKKRIH